jgi:hypothetical protein
MCSAIGHVRFTPNSDINCVFRHVCFGPIADMRKKFISLVGNWKFVEAWRFALRVFEVFFGYLIRRHLNSLPFFELTDFFDF